VGRDQLKGASGKSVKGSASAKASAESVIGKKVPRGRLNKRLILGVIASAVVGMLVLNFLPAGNKTKGSGDGADAVYANDSMPQDVKELAMRAPEVPMGPATSTQPSGYSRMSTVNNPFEGYTTGTRAVSAREASAQSATGPSKDYQGMAVSDARLEAEKAARRAPMEVATKL